MSLREKAGLFEEGGESLKMIVWFEGTSTPFKTQSRKAFLRKRVLMIHESIWTRDAYKSFNTFTKRGILVGNKVWKKSRSIIRKGKHKTIDGIKNNF